MVISSSVPRVRSVVDDKQSTVDLVAAEVRRAILTGQLAPGQPFAVTDLTGPLGVSHIPVREALRRLEAQGLVVLGPARRPVVAPLDLDDLDSIYDLRLRLEPELLRKSVPLRTSAWIAELDGYWSAAFGGVAPADVTRENHSRLHRALVRPAMSAWEQRILEQLWDAAERYTNLVYHPHDIHDEAERVRRAEVHLGIVDAVRGGNPEAAEKALYDHLAESLVTIRKLAAVALTV